MYVTVCLSQTKFSFTLSLAAATGQTSACTASQSLLSLPILTHTLIKETRNSSKGYPGLILEDNRFMFQTGYYFGRMLFFKVKSLNAVTPAACQYYQLYSSHRALKAGQQLSSTTILTTISHTFKSKNANYPFKESNYLNKHCDAL